MGQDDALALGAGSLSSLAVFGHPCKAFSVHKYLHGPTVGQGIQLIPTH